MSMLSRFIAAHIKATAVQKKDFASRFFDDLLKRVGEERAGKWETVQPKLSKFLKGDVEGERHFMDDAERLRSLAHVVGESEERLLALGAVRTLVLDPRLPQDARAYLKAASVLPEAGHDCVEVDASDIALSSRRPEDRSELRSALRARAEENHGSIVVLHDLDDRLFFEGGQIEVTTLTQRPLGWVLSSNAALVQLPSPPAPALYDRDTGPLVPAPELIESVRAALKCLNERYSREPVPETPFSSEQLRRMEPRRQKADAIGAELTFRVSDLAPWLSKRNGIDPGTVTWSIRSERWEREEGTLRPEELAKRCFEAVTSAPVQTLVWNHGERLFATGPQAEAVGSMLAPHHDVGVPRCFDPWRTALAAWNPWRTLPPSGWGHTKGPDGLSERWRALADEINQEIGVQLGDVIELWRSMHAPEPLPPTPWTVRFDEDEEARCRQCLVELIARPFSLDLSGAHILFRLRLASEATLLPLPRGARDRCHFLANLGAGHLLRVRVLAYPTEEPMEIFVVRQVRDRRFDSAQLDGGDVHVFLEGLDDALLEASPMPAIKRRAIAAADEAARAADEAARAADDDD